MSSFLRESRREAERLLQKLGRGLHLADDIPARVYFPLNFGEGNCRIVAVIPTQKIRFGLRRRVVMAHSRYSTPPAMINTRHGCELRLAYRFRKINPKETERVSEYAKMISEWIQETFRLRATVICVPGLASLCRKFSLSLREEAHHASTY